MWKEFLTALIIYAFVMLAHIGHKHYEAWRERKQDEAKRLAALDAISPFQRPIITPHAHAFAFMAGCIGPSCLEAVKHYVVHFLIYSGYVIPH